MKKITIKSALMRLVAVLLLTLGTISASAQYYQMKVRSSNGQVTWFNTTQIDSIYFEFVEPKDNGNDVNDVNETSVTGNATDITAFTATITSWANILDNLSSDLKVGVIYTLDGNPTRNNGIQKTIEISDLDTDAKYTMNLTDLTPDTTYYYRSFVYQSGIWFYGDVKSFTTKSNRINLITGQVNKLTCYSAQAYGTIINEDEALYSGLKYGICFSKDSVPQMNSLVYATTIGNDGIFSCQLRGLSGSTTYYYRSFIKIGDFEEYGPIRSFTTKDDDVVITGDIDTTTYSVKSTLKIGSGAYSTLELGVCYGINSTPTLNDQIVTTNEVDDENDFTLKLKDIDILFGTVYYRSFVKIDGVAHYGVIKIFEHPAPIGEAVDLGLSVKWATFNVGASKPEEYGCYYAWGETEPKTYYNESTYKYCNDSFTRQTKYCNNSSYGYNGFTDTLTTLLPEDDVAHVKWGGSWRMPTIDEFTELLNNCTWTWTTLNGVNGYRVTSKKSGYTDRSIFLPAAGLRDYRSLYAAGENGHYWSSSLYTDSPGAAHLLGFGSSFRGTDDGCSRTFGQSVRPVCPSEEWLNAVSITLNSNLDSIVMGNTITLSATVKHGNEVIDREVTWISDNPSIASVSETGVVTAITVGSTTITAIFMGKTATCTITVIEPQYEYVDLGLSVKWATFNVGATKPEDYGDYYAWGETEPKTDYDWSTYKYCNGSYSTLTKYCNDSSYGNNGFTDTKTTLDPDDDVAHVKWGGSWRMPTKDEFTELLDNCTWTWTTLNDVDGYRVTSNKSGYTDRSIFLPAAGSRGGTSLNGVGRNGYYWSSSLLTVEPCNAYYFNFDSDDVNRYGVHRCIGPSVRPVCP